MKRLAAFVLATALVAGCSHSSTPSAPQTHTASPPLARSAAVSAPIPGHYIVVFKNNVANVSSLATAIA